MVLEPTSTFAPVVKAASKKIVSELQDLEVSSCCVLGIQFGRGIDGHVPPWCLVRNQLWMHS
jgi:hypothetical protein